MLDLQRPRLANPVFRAVLDDVQRRHILEVLQRTGWRISGTKGAARILDMKPGTLRARMEKLGIRRES